MSFNVNLFLKAKRLGENFCFRSLNDYKMVWNENDLKKEQQTIDFFYTTMIHDWLWENASPDVVLPLWIIFLILPSR